MRVAHSPMVLNRAIRPDQPASPFTGVPGRSIAYASSFITLRQRRHSCIPGRGQFRCGRRSAELPAPFGECPSFAGDGLVDGGVRGQVLVLPLELAVEPAR